MSAVAIQPRWLTQRGAAEYLSVSVTHFRESVHVQPKPIAKPVPGKKVLLRYDVYELDAWVDSCAAIKADPRKGANV